MRTREELHQLQRDTLRSMERELSETPDIAVLPSGGGSGVDLEWWGQIVSTGPASEPDYSDERYWVKAVRCSLTVGGGTDRISLEEIPLVDPGYKHETVTNLAELALGVHTMKVGLYVKVFPLYDQQTPRVLHWAFQEDSFPHKPCNPFVE